MHKVAFVTSFACLLVVSSANGIAEVDDMGQIAVNRSFVVPTGVKIIHGSLGFIWVLIM